MMSASSPPQDKLTIGGSVGTGGRSPKYENERSMQAISDVNRRPFNQKYYYCEQQTQKSSRAVESRKEASNPDWSICQLVWIVFAVRSATAARGKVVERTLSARL